MTSPSDRRACNRCGLIRLVKNGHAHCLDCAKVRPPRDAAPRADQLAGYSVRRAETLACMVRDEGRDSIGDFLDRLDRQALYGLTVALAAMVPVDQRTEDLLAWVYALEGVAA